MSQVGTNPPERALDYLRDWTRPMQNTDIPQHRPEPCQGQTKGSASVASVRSSLCFACTVDDELAPTLRTAINALKDFSLDRPS